VFDVLLRVLKDRLLEPLARLLGARVAPNAVTVLAFLVGLGAGAAGWRRAYGLALALWALNRLLDGLDGSLARVHGRRPTSAATSTSCSTSPSTRPCPPGSRWAARRPGARRLRGAARQLLRQRRVVDVPVGRAGAPRRGRGGARRAHHGDDAARPHRGAETVVLYTLFLLVPSRLTELFALMAALVYATVAQRLVWAHRHLR
jgi:hypothetical protein